MTPGSPKSGDVEDGNATLYCERCEGDGSFREMAPCTTFGPGCGCSEWVTVDPCPECNGSGAIG